MKNRKNNKITLFTLFVIIITIIALIATSGTYAKYTDSVSATSTATVAKWNVTANAIDMHTTNTITFNIFDTIFDSNYRTLETNVQQPSASDAPRVIAPGTSGYKDLTIVNSSDVDIELAIAFEKDASSPLLPIEFAMLEDPDSNTRPSDSDFYSASDFALYLAGELPDGQGGYVVPTIDTQVPFNTNGNANQKVFRVYWRWAFEGTENGADIADTNFGSAAANTQDPLDPYMVTIDITATQVD